MAPADHAQKSLAFEAIALEAHGCLHSEMNTIQRHLFKVFKLQPSA